MLAPALPRPLGAALARVTAGLVRSDAGATVLRRLPYVPPDLVFGALPHVYRPERGGRAVGVLEIRLTGPGGGRWQVDIRRDGLDVQRGGSRKPRARMTTDVFTWTAIAMRRLDGTEAFMRGRVAVEGDLALTLRLDACLG